jgi:hypothetical protein
MILSLQVNHCQINITTISQGMMSVSLRPFALSHDDYFSLLYQLTAIQHPHMLHGPGVDAMKILESNGHESGKQSQKNEKNEKKQSYILFKFVLINYTPENKFILTSSSIDYQYNSSLLTAGSGGGFSGDNHNTSPDNGCHSAPHTDDITPTSRSTVLSGLQTDYNQSVHVMSHDNGHIELVTTSSFVKSLAVKLLTIQQLKTINVMIDTQTKTQIDSVGVDLGGNSSKSKQNFLKSGFLTLLKQQKGQNQQQNGNYNYNIGADPQLFIKQSTIGKISFFDPINRIIPVIKPSTHSHSAPNCSVPAELSLGERFIRQVSQVESQQNDKIRLLRQEIKYFVLQPCHSLSELLKPRHKPQYKSIYDNYVKFPQNGDVLSVTRGGGIFTISQEASETVLAWIILQLSILGAIFNPNIGNEKDGSDWYQKSLEKTNKVTKTHPDKRKADHSRLTPITSAIVTSYHSSQTHLKLSNPSTSLNSTQSTQSYLRFCHLTPVLNFILSHCTQETKFDEQFLTSSFSRNVMKHIFIHVLNKKQQQYAVLLFYQWYLHYLVKIYQLYGIFDPNLNSNDGNYDQGKLIQNSSLWLDQNLTTNPQILSNYDGIVNEITIGLQNYTKTTHFYLKSILPIPINLSMGSNLSGIGRGHDKNGWRNEDVVEALGELVMGFFGE